MGVRFYDEALVKKLSGWVRTDQNLKILKPDETTRFFEMKLDDQKDSPLQLPLISISRDKSIEILNLEKQEKTFSGFLVSNEYEDGKKLKKHITLNAIPIQIGYQIDIYTRKIDEADEYVRNFIFNFINYPKLEINIPYNGLNMKHRSTIHLESSVMDNSDIREHLFADQFVRFTIKIIVDDAYLFSAPVTDIPIIDGVVLGTDFTEDIAEDVDISEETIN